MPHWSVILSPFYSRLLGSLIGTLCGCSDRPPRSTGKEAGRYSSDAAGSAATRSIGFDASAAMWRSTGLYFAGARHAGWRIGSSCGAVSSPAQSRFPWFSVGSILNRFPALSITTARFFRLPDVHLRGQSSDGSIIFHGLVWSALLVIAGVMLAMRRRMRDEGAAAVQAFGEDFLPLILLFAISVSGLLLTASYTWMKGYAYDFLAIAHAVTVIFTLLWLPFGKFFHIFQRPAQLGVSFYKDAGARDGAGALSPLSSSVQLSNAHRRFDRSRARARLSLRDAAQYCSSLSVDLPALSACAARSCSRSIVVACRPRRAPMNLFRVGVLLAVLRQSGARRGAARRGRQKQFSSLRTMALLPASVDEIVAIFGPHLARSQGRRLDTGVVPDKVVKTHCCFCGQQCGIQLLVKDNQVIGFEPWMEFPFNRGKLCPKGVKRYLQGSHPDRLLHAYRARSKLRPAVSAHRLRAAIARVAG